MDKKRNILLVDDHTVVRKGMKLLIQSKLDNVILIEAESGAIALDYCSKSKIDMVITDITMPEMNGIELARIISEKYPLIKVIVLSMHLDEMYVKDAIDAGAMGYLSKAMEDENEILQAVETVFAGNTFYGKKTSQSLIKGMFDSKDKSLTKKETEIAKHLSNGLVYKEIAANMNISSRTVETYRKNILEKLKLKTTADIIKYAIKHGIVALD